MKKVVKKQKMLIIIILSITVVAICVLSVFFNSEQIKKTFNKKLQEEEAEIISLTIQIKSETDTISKCLLVFEANNPNELIKNIEYPLNGEETPTIITVDDENGRETVAIDYDVAYNKVNSVFKVTTTTGQVIDKVLGIKIYDENGGEPTEDFNGYVLKRSNNEYPVTNLTPKREGYHFLGWSKDKNATEADYFKDAKFMYNGEMLYAVWTKQNNGYKETLANDSLIGEVSKINESGEHAITVNGVTYNANVIVEDRDLILDGLHEVAGAKLSSRTYEFGNENKDVATADEEAKNMVILKVNGNLTITNRVQLTTCKSSRGYGGPKGLLVYVTGTLSNNGTINMSQRGAKATGQNVYLWKNSDNSYEYVPATGGAGKATVVINNTKQNGVAGEDGKGRQTGGGGQGAAGDVGAIDTTVGKGGGGAGTSYSGGAGGGGAYADATSTHPKGKNGSSIGGEGGDGARSGKTTDTTDVSGGAGNSAGTSPDYNGNNGTGGLLICYSKNIIHKGNIYSNGSDCVSFASYPGGASGGGSINIFYKDEYKDMGNITATGGAATGYVYKGGKGRKRYYYNW